MKPFTNHTHGAPFETGAAAGNAFPTFPRAYAIGPDYGIAVEWGWSTWRDAVADRAADLRTERRTYSARNRRGRPLGRVRSGGIAAAVVVSLAAYGGLIAVARTLIAHPQVGLPVGLVALGLVGVALAQRGGR